MMLPEHKEALLLQQKKLDRKDKPIIDEQQLQEMSQAISEAAQQNALVCLTIYHPFQDKTIIGLIRTLDPIEHRIELRNPGGPSHWLALQEIIEITVLKS